MPVTPELEAAATLLAAHADRTEVVTLLKTKAGAIHHAIHQEGFNGGYGKGTSELATAQTALTEAQAARTKAEADLVEARKANPDVAKLHTDYQAQINTVEEKAKARETELLGGIKAEKLTGAKATLVAKLKGLGVQSDLAEVLAEKQENASRFVVADDGTVSVLQPGLTIPYTGDGMTLLADAIRAKVPPGLITAKVDGGAGGNGGDQGAAGIVAKIQKEAADRKAAAAAARANTTSSDGLPKSLSGMAIKSA